MRTRLGVALLLLFIGTNPLESQGSRVDSLAWLAGCWRMTARNSLVDEQWMSPRAGTMLGMSRTVRQDSVTSSEFVRITESGGRLVYAAHPYGQAPAEFREKSWNGAELVFENLAHDFPQRILYRRAGTDSLIAEIEGEMGGRVRRIAYPYRRIACPGSPPAQVPR